VRSPHELPPGPDPPREMHVFVETARGARSKHRYEHELGFLRLNRVLAPGLAYPVDYGFFPRTSGDDGYPLDAMVVGGEPLMPGTLAVARPVGILDIVDAGKPDAKVLCVLREDRALQSVVDAGALGEARLDAIAQFFRAYKRWTGEHGEVLVQGWRGRDDALARVEEGLRRFGERK
jgi:inorganic pyrophosphatase